MKFNFAATAIIGHILLNVFSAIQQSLPIKKVIMGLFNEIGVKNKIEEIVSTLLLMVLYGSFSIFIIDTQVNGMQLVSPQGLK